MKISDIQQQANTMQYVNQANSSNSPDKPQPSPSKEAEDKSSSQDKVELSVESKEMQKVYDVLQMTPDVRDEKVSALKESIQQGQYQIDSEALADKMIRESILDLIK
jgi:negative regulator of flagellin synthesis FlgM